MTEKYYCKYCDYSSKISSNFKKHLISSKHLENIKNNVENISNIKKYKRLVFNCEFCNNDFMGKSSLTRHQNRCVFKKDKNMETLKKQFEEIQEKLQTEIKSHMQARIDYLEENRKDIIKIVEKSTSAIKKSANVANKSMSLLKYVKINFPDAPPLETLKKKDAYNMLG